MYIRIHEVEFLFSCQFLQAHWQSDPCYAFYGVDGGTCSILAYLSQIEGFCPSPSGRSGSGPAWHQRPDSHTEKVLPPQSCSKALNIPVHFLWL